MGTEEKKGDMLKSLHLFSYIKFNGLMNIVQQHHIACQSGRLFSRPRTMAHPTTSKFGAFSIQDMGKRIPFHT